MGSIKDLKKRMRARSPFEKVIYASLIVGLVASVSFVVLDAGDVTFSAYCVACIAAGSLVGLADVFLSREALLWVSSLFYTAGVGFHLYAALPSISDLWNHVNFIGGNQTLAIVFGSIFVAVMAVLLVSNFVIERGSGDVKQK